MILSAFKCVPSPRFCKCICRSTHAWREEEAEEEEEEEEDAWRPAEEEKEYDNHEEERVHEKTRTLVNRIIYTSA